MTKKNKKKEIDAAIGGLIKNGDLMADPRYFTPSFEINDIWKTYAHLFTKEAKEAIYKVKTTTLVHQYNVECTDGTMSRYTPPSEFGRIAKLLDDSDDPTTYTILDFMYQLGIIERGTIVGPAYKRELAQVRYLGAKIKKGMSIEDAVTKIATQINDYVDKDYIMGHLSPLSILDLGKESCVVIYLIFNQDGIDHLEATKPEVEFSEGGMPNELED